MPARHSTSPLPWLPIGLLLGLVQLLAAPARAAVPTQFSVQGVVRDAMGKLQSMNVSVTVTLFDSQMNGNALAGPYGPTMVAAVNGLFTVAIDDPQLKSKLAPAASIWLELAINNDVYPRQSITSQLFAVAAQTAAEADRLSVACVGCVSDAHIANVAATKVTGKVAACVNADTVTNGVYTDQMYANPPFITSLAGAKITGTVASCASSQTAVTSQTAVNSTQLGGLDNTHFMRSDINTGTAGTLTVGGATTVGGNLQVNGVVRGATFGFGGTYEYACVNIGANCGCVAGQGSYALVANNPFTGGASCPGGFGTYINYFFNGTNLIYCQVFCVR